MTIVASCNKAEELDMGMNSLNWPRRRLALLIEIPIGLILVVSMAILVHKKEIVLNPNVLKLHVYALCPENDSAVTAPLELFLEGMNIRGRLYYGRPINQQFACAEYLIVSNKEVVDPRFKPTINASGTELDVEKKDGVPPSGHAYFLFGTLRNSLNAIEFVIPNFIKIIQSGRVDLIIDGSEFQFFKNSWPKKSERFVGGYVKPEGLKYHPVTYMRLFPDNGFSLLNSSPSPVLPKVVWSKVGGESRDEFESGESETMPKVRYDFEFSSSGSAVRVSLLNSEKSNRDIGLRGLYSILLGIGVGFLIDSVKYFIRG